jgi:hypothetical protein
MNIPKEIQDLMPERKTYAECQQEADENFGFNKAITGVEAVLPQMLALAEKRGVEAERERAIYEVEIDMEMIVKEIDRLRERDEEGDEYRRQTHTRDYAMLKHTLTTLTQPNHE